MIDINPLYDPIRHRYKGVYQGARFGSWDAIVQSPGAKLLRLGRFSSPEEAARTVAGYYLNQYGPVWPLVIKHRRQPIVVKKVTRLLYMADLHLGPRTFIYDALVLTPQNTYHKLKLEDVFPPDTDDATISTMWHIRAGGWKTYNAAVIAARMYRELQCLSRPSDSEGSTVSPSTGAKSG